MSLAGWNATWMVVVLGASGALSANLSAAEGLVLFSRGIMEDVGENDAPKARERLQRVELYALRGAYEPFTFAVRNHGGKPLAFKAGLSAFVHEQDAARTIPLKEIEIRGLRKGAKLGRRTTKDWVLWKRGQATAPPGGNARFWVTVHVPEEAAPGRYRATLRVEGGGKKSETPVRLRVLKARARPVPGVRFYLLGTVSPYGQYWRNVKPAERKRLKPKVIAFYRELKAHGMTGVCMKSNDWPYKEGRIGGLIAEVEAALEAGLNGPIVWNMQALIDAAKGGDRHDFNGRCDNWNEKKDLARLKKIFKLAQQTAKAKNWPEIIYYTIDEPGTQTQIRKFLYLRMAILEKTARSLKELGARSHSTITECVDEKHNRAPRWSKTPGELRRIWERCRPFLSVRNYGYGYPQGKTNLFHEMADARKRGQEVWIYNNAAVMGRNRYAARMYFGLWAWKAGIDGVTAWTYPGGRTVQFELIREGIDDYKYLALLRKLINEKKGSAEDRTAAKKFLQELRAAIQFDKNGFIGDWENVAKAGIAAVRPAKLKTGWKALDFDAFRRRAAEWIEKLAGP